MAYQEVIALLGTDIKQSGECKQCVQREEGDNAMKVYELQALEKNHRNKLLLQR